MRERTQAPLQAALLAAAVVAALAAPSLAATASPPPQTTFSHLTTIVGEIVAVDPATRHVTIRGPLGGELSGKVSDEVKNFDQVKVGDMMSIAYREQLALSVQRPGQPDELYKGGDAASSAPGEKPSLEVSEQSKRTVTVFSVDPAKKSVVLQEADGSLVPVEVERADLVRKLQTLRVGDKIDIVTTEAIIARVAPASEGQQPSVSSEVSTLIVEHGEVLSRTGNVLTMRDARGRTVRVSVDPKTKFNVDGKEVNVFSIRPGTKLTRTALQVLKVETD